MKRENMLKVENYFEAFIIILLMFFFFLLIKPFILALLFAVTLVFLTRKPYLFLVKKIKNENVSANILLLLILLILTLPIYIIGSSLISQSSALISTSTSIFEMESLENCSFEKVCPTIEKNIVFFNSQIASMKTKIKDFIVESIGSIFNSVAIFFLNLFIFAMAYFFIQKDGDKFASYIRRIIPMKNEYKDALFLRFRDVSLAVFLDNILVAIMQGILLALGFWMFGLSSPLFWGIVASFFALFPMVGTAIVWVPVAAYIFFTGDYLKLIGFVLYCAIIVGTSDNVVRPLLLHKKIHVHPFVILLGILGGIELFGFLGIFLGPILISLLIAVLQLYKLDFK